MDALYNDLRHQILIGDEKPGSVMTEVSVANRYEVARPTAKAAVERLVADGLVVRSRRGAGASVRVFTREDIGDLYETRILVESAVNVTLANRQSRVVAADAANGRLRVAAAAGQASGIVAADIAFHRALVSEIGGMRLTRLHDQLMGEAHFCMAQVQELQLLGAEQIADEHAGIVAAIRGGDPSSANSLTIDHLDRARTRLLDRVSVMAADRELPDPLT